MYSNRWLANIIDLKNKIEHNGILISDVVRIFIEDNIAAQLGSELLKNGYYFCWQCPLLADNSPNIVHTMPFPS